MESICFLLGSFPFFVPISTRREITHRACALWIWATGGLIGALEKHIRQRSCCQEEQAGPVSDVSLCVWNPAVCNSVQYCSSPRLSYFLHCVKSAGGVFLFKPNYAVFGMPRGSFSNTVLSQSQLSWKSWKCISTGHRWRCDSSACCLFATSSFF